ncbi:UDP-glucose 4-epimerase-like [Ylistrum balloti]|uniref:UDP-glucose 4-epimerase-like n=1 Tax=Ylistrum balloti TaxID=509963 RepID=UPI00290594AE|nr:UDP-glucose 4-epimerase-like [Ylistrum balloti]
MRALVVGGAGYIGSHVVFYLLKDNCEVLVLDNLSFGSESSIPKGADFVLGDIRNKEVLTRCMQNFKPEVVVHLAALKSVGKSIHEIAVYSDINITGTINLLNAMIAQNIPYFVFSSSAAVYGTPVYLPIDEKHPTKPINYYGETKLIIEQMLQWYSRAYPFYYSALRYFNASGHEPASSFFAIEKNPENLIPILLETALGTRKDFTLFGDDYDTPDGSCIRDYIHVSDLARAHLLSLHFLKEKKQSLTLNLGTGKGFSTREAYESAVRVTKKDIPLTIGGRREGDPASMYALSDRARNLLAWQPKYNNIDDIILHSWKAYQRNFET